jgi:hypothetical protein
MDQEKEKLKTLLVHRSATQDGTSWERLVKALRTFTELEVLERDELPIAELSQLIAAADHVFLDLGLADWNALGANPQTKLTLVKKDAFPWNNPQARELMVNGLCGHSCLLTEDFSATDLVRLLHLYLVPKRQLGVVPLLEKEAVIVGEKIQGLEAIGSLLDKLCTYFDQMEGLQVKSRLLDLRQVLSALVTEAFQRTQKTNIPYPTVDFQASASAGRFVLNLRFPKADLKLKELARMIVDGTDLFWSQIWLCSDVLVLTDHLLHNELEVMLIINRPSRPSQPVFRSLLTKSLDRSGKKENLLIAPQNFGFQILSEIKLKRNDVMLLKSDSSGDEVDGGLDLNGLPEAVVEKITALESKVAYFSEQQTKKDAQLKEALERSLRLGKELSQKRTEAERYKKTLEVQEEALRKKTAEMDRKVEFLQSQAKNGGGKTDTESSATLQEAIVKLEGGLRAAENEKTQLNEKLTNEQKRVSILEQKYSALFKDISLKDKEINDLKAALVRLKKESTGGAASSAGKKDGASDGLTQKLKESESREAVFKQELRKLAFKLENQEKQVKAVQAESGEKLKLLEQKLQDAKAKELELLKKIDDLSSALKKAAKAA